MPNVTTKETKSEAALIKERAIKSVVKQLDKTNRCYCEGYDGKNHDVNPPCETVRKATDIVNSIQGLLKTSRV